MIEQPYMEGKTIHEKQMRYWNGYFCPYCDRMADLVDSSIVHQESHGLIFHCKHCSAHVSTTNGDISLGSLAKEPLRKTRRQCYEIVEKLIARKVSFGKITTKVARSRMRKWLMEILNITEVECHIGYWNTEQCNLVIKECQKYFPTEEELRRLAEVERHNTEAIVFFCEENELKLKEWNLNGKHQIEVTLPDKRRFTYFPRYNSGGFDIKAIDLFKDNIETLLPKLLLPQDEPEDTTKK